MACRTLTLSRPFLFRLKINRGRLPGRWYGFFFIHVLTGLPDSHIFQICAVNCWLASISPLSSLRSPSWLLLKMGWLIVVIGGWPASVVPPSLSLRFWLARVSFDL